jgi:hypothetical protein
MIEIKVDKESEMIWLQNIIGAGVLNTDQAYTMKFLGVPLKQNITYKPSDDYEDDVEEKREEFNRRFGNKGLRRREIEQILKKELTTKE